MSTTSLVRDIDNRYVKPHPKESKYIVGGGLAARAESYRTQLKEVTQGLRNSPHEKPLPFDSIVNVNVGNPQQLGQRPITFFRQVLSLLEHPLLLERADLLINELGYQPDVIKRAQWLLNECNSVGAYSQSQGVPAIRKRVAHFIERTTFLFHLNAYRFRSHLILECAWLTYLQSAIVTRPTLHPSISLLVLHLESIFYYMLYARNRELVYLCQFQYILSIAQRSRC
jgi:hypothetical protein